MLRACTKGITTVNPLLELAYSPEALPPLLQLRTLGYDGLRNVAKGNRSLYPFSTYASRNVAANHWSSGATQHGPGNMMSHLSPTVIAYILDMVSGRQMR